MAEKMAVTLGVLYRHQAAQWPRRSHLLKNVWKKEIAFNPTEIPAAKRELSKVVQFIESKQYQKLSVREGLVYVGVALEMAAWFFVGEMIGRGHVFGYLVPSNYVSAEAKHKAKEIAEEKKRNEL